MGSINGEISKELLEAQSHLWNHTFSFINSMSLKCAIELGIPDIIHRNEKPMSLTDLSNALSIPQSKIPHLRRLMRLLVHSKFFSEHQKLFSLTKFSEILIKKKSGSLFPFVHLVLGETLLSQWHYLSNWFKCDGPPTAFEIAHGMPIWEATGKSDEFNSMMNEGISSDASFTAEIFVRDCGEVFRGLSSLVDVGGGMGTLARAIARAFPAVKCTVLDLPHVIEDLDGESEMVQFVGGDMFEHVPPADATLLKHMAGGDASLSTTWQVLHTRDDMPEDVMQHQRTHWEHLAAGEQRFREENLNFPLLQTILPLQAEASIMQDEFPISVAKERLPLVGQRSSISSRGSSSGSGFYYSRDAEELQMMKMYFEAEQEMRIKLEEECINLRQDVGVMREAQRLSDKRIARMEVRFMAPSASQSSYW